MIHDPRDWGLCEGTTHVILWLRHRAVTLWGRARNDLSMGRALTLIGKLIDFHLKINVLPNSRFIVKPSLSLCLYHREIQ
jgi:hypothetical protein